MLPIVAWINLAIGLIAAAVAFREDALALALGIFVAATTVFATLRALNTIIELLENIRYNTKQVD